MPSWLPSVPYPALKEGYWLPVTSTLNWCEEDYYATIYSAEIVNTVTNFLFMLLAYRGVRNCITEGHDSIFVVTFLGYGLVGTGSFFFHATLKYPWQLVDELSMIYTTCIMFYATFSHNQKPLVSLLLALFMTGLAVFITVYYHIHQDPTFHQNAFGLLTAAVLLRSMYVMEVGIRPSLRKKEEVHETMQKQHVVTEEQKDEQIRQDKRDRQTLKTMWVLVGNGLLWFLAGFAFWNIDNELCGTLRTWRRQVGLPWGLLLEGHGWWHLMTGAGCYFYIVWGIWLRHYLSGGKDDYDLIWPNWYAIPTVVRNRKGRAAMNGSAKKTL